MCVTVGPAEITGTMVFTYATLDDSGQPVHVTGYQNTSSSDGPNCMLLHFPGTDITVVSGPERTSGLMDDLTSRIPQVEPVAKTRGMSFGAAADTFAPPVVEVYGDYDLVLAQDPTQMMSVLSEMSSDRRPPETPELVAMFAWYGAQFPDSSFVLAGFNGRVDPTHPIAISYKPHDPEILFAPGLDGHTGGLPVIGQRMARDFRVAFGVDHYLGHDGPITYSDVWINPDRHLWAPKFTVGFHDNRFSGKNGDYRIPRDLLGAGSAVHGLDLFAARIV